MKHAQKMVIIPEHLLQSMETERRLTAPVQLPTLTRLDQANHRVSFTRRPKSPHVGSNSTAVSRTDKTNEN